LIKNGIIVNAESTQVGDVLIRGDKIVQIGKNLKAPIGSRVIDATGKFVMPGGIDPHVHMEVRKLFLELKFLLLKFFVVALFFLYSIHGNCVC